VINARERIGEPDQDLDHGAAGAPGEATR
jgi:hypothetical protein